MVAADHDQDALSHRVGMAFDERPHRRHLLDDPHFHEPNDARVRETPHEDQFPEVLVFRNQYPLFPVSKSE